jgi:hypothetical protein
MVCLSGLLLPKIYLEKCRNSLRFTLGFLLAMFAQGYMASSVAYDLTQKFNATQSAELNDNIRLRSSGEKSIWLFKFMPNYEAILSDSLNVYDLRVGMNVQRSEDDQVMNDRDDPRLDFSWQREYVRGSFGAKLHYDRVTTQVSELDDSGIVFEDGSRISRSFDLNWKHFLQERLALGASATVSSVDYQNSSLNPFDSQNYNGSLTYFNSERLSSTLSFGFLQQDRESTGTVNSKSINLGANYEYSDRLSLNFIVGMRKNSGSDSGAGSLYDMGFKYMLERGKLTGSYSRSINPSGANGLIETDRLRLTANYDLNQLWQLTASYSLNKNNSINETEIEQVDFALFRTLGKYWKAKAYVSHRERDADSGQAESNGAGVAFIFNSPEF